MHIGSTVTVSFRALRRNAMRSILTALGIIIGVVEQLAGYFLPPGTQDVTSNVVLLGVLVLRPQGLFGQTIRKRV